MKGTTGIKTLGLVLLLVPILISFFAGAVYAQPWSRLALDEGGVGEDVQLQRFADNTLDSVVWSANMEGGIFRAEWDSGWGSWTEYLPGRGAYGVEAIKLGSTEHVLAATGTMGIWYEDDPPTYGEWQRPNGDLAYPDNWEYVWTHDVAFYCDENGDYGVTPEDSFFVILTQDVTTANPHQNRGIYRWSGVQSPDNYFKRVDADDNDDPARGFMHFWRDLSDGNVLYVTAEDGIYKLWGEYRHPRFEKLPPQTKLEDLPIAWPPADLPPLPAMPQVDRAPACMMGRMER